MTLGYRTTPNMTVAVFWNAFTVPSWVQDSGLSPSSPTGSPLFPGCWCPHLIGQGRCQSHKWHCDKTSTYRTITTGTWHEISLWQKQKKKNKSNEDSARSALMKKLLWVKVEIKKGCGSNFLKDCFLQSAENQKCVSQVGKDFLGDILYSDGRHFLPIFVPKYLFPPCSACWVLTPFGIVLGGTEVWPSSLMFLSWRPSVLPSASTIPALFGASKAPLVSVELFCKMACYYRQMKALQIFTCRPEAHTDTQNCLDTPGIRPPLV